MAKQNITLKRILRIIKDNNLSFKEFAESCSLSQGNFTDWKNERVKPSLEALRKIAKTYNVQLEWLTGDSKYRTKEQEFNELRKEKAKTNK